MAVYNNWPPSILLPRGSGKSLRLYLWWMSLPDYVKDIWVRCDKLHKQNKDDQKNRRPFLFYLTHINQTE